MKTHFTLFVLMLLLYTFNSRAQSGCTDPQANNYNASATVNDGSCTYNTTNLSLTAKANLATPILDENSGIEFMSNGLWTFNDSGNSNDIYRVDSATGAVLQTVAITNATNVDWEDITSDNNFLYIGDFGNNSGNRTDLKIYRIAKSDLTPVALSATATIIDFSFSDQTSFVANYNNNNFDCEALIFYNDSLHLFSKDWVDKQTRHYVLDATPGSHVAQMRETLNAGYLVTGASVQAGGVVALCGYDNTGIAPIYLYMLYDYKAPFLFNGNKRRFDLSSAIANGQVEGVSFRNSAYGYISNERFIQSIFNVAPKLKAFNLSSYLPAQFVNPPPVADFSVNDDTICKGTTLQFTDGSSHSPTQWQWTFTGGTPASSTIQNPVVTYNTAGVFAVTLTASNSGGNNSITKNTFVKVYALPTATVTINGSTNLCPGDSVQLIAVSNNAYKYQWVRNGVNIQGATKSTYVAKKFGSYKVIITNKNTQCTKVSAVQKITAVCREGLADNEIEVYPNPSASVFYVHANTTSSIKVEVIDVVGRIVESHIYSSQDEIQFGNELTSGLYLVKVSGSDFVKTIRIIKS